MLHCLRDAASIRLGTMPFALVPGSDDRYWPQTSWCTAKSWHAQDAEWFEAKKSRQGTRGLGANGYGNGRPSPAPRDPRPPAVVNELDEDVTDVTDAAIEALAKGAGLSMTCVWSGSLNHVARAWG